jgi:hypothetical protein
MPVIIHPAGHAASGVRNSKFPTCSLELLQNGNITEFKRCKDLLQSSFSSENSKNIIGTNNGFVQACIKAYSNHHHLQIRPDDVWITILTQLSLYVNANAESLRSHFVSHQGQKELSIEAIGTRYTVPWAAIADQFAAELGQNVKDPSLQQWVLQSFSTTTDTDRAVAAIAMMGTLQSNFSFKAYLRCGIPSVTLHGTREDWVQLRDAVVDPTKLPSLGVETAEWSRVLGVVLDHFVDSFDNPDTPETKMFWQTIAHHSGGGSGPRYWSGWITAFCFWDDEGKSLRPKLNVADDSAESEYRSRHRNTEDTTLRIDNQTFHKVDSNDLPSAWVSVPVVVNEFGTEFKARMVAGCIGYSVQQSGQEQEKGGLGLDTVTPEIGWWMFEEKESGL